MSRGGVEGERSRLRRRCRSEGLEASPFTQLRQTRLLSGDTLANRCLHYPLGDPSDSPVERLERFPLSKSGGRSSPERSPPARSPLVSPPPALRSAPVPACISPERRRGFTVTSFPSLNGAESPILARRDSSSPNRNAYRSSPAKSPPKLYKELTYKELTHKELTHKEPTHRHSPIRNGQTSPYRHATCDRLPKVEELFEKLEYPPDLMDYSELKQPLKSILNNPRKSPPPGILKKKKVQEKGEAKRRPRAMSESEYYLHPDTERTAVESRLQDNLSNMKRLKDNSGSIHTNNRNWDHMNRSPPKRVTSPMSKDRSLNGETKTSDVTVLRTTAIRREVSPVCGEAGEGGEGENATHTNTWLRKRANKCRAVNNMHTLTPSGVGVCEGGIEAAPGDTALCCLPHDLLGEPSVNTKAGVVIPYELSHCVRPSLFPRVPPYYRFIGHDQTPPLKPPLAIAKHLKWKLTSITPIVVKKTLLNSGFRLVRSDCETSEAPQEETVQWVGIWGKHMKSLMFRAIKDGQKMNHFPGTFQVGRKDRLWRNLQKLVQKYGLKEFGIMPKTYVLPHDMKLLKRDWEKYAARNEKWIIKPPASARGTGIAVVSRWSEIPKKRSVVVQRYISQPYLINGSKFDLRLYVLVTSVHPIRIYLFSDGLARFASVKYTDDQATLHDRYMHLTNYSINRMSKNYTSNEDAGACQGHKWTLQTLLQYLKRERGVDTDELWERLKELVIKTIISGESTIRSLTEANITSRYNCYELFGIDVLLDEVLKPWLLEVNISPSLHSSSPLDLYVKAPLVTSVLNIAQFHLPRPSTDSATNARNQVKYAHVLYDPRLYTVYLSKEERDKHIIYSKMESREEYLTDILSTLTPDDVRHLIQAEDELAAGGVRTAPPPPAPHPPHMERIFPTPDTYKYLEFLPTPKYYNRLLDAWENKYKDDRTPGINLLQSFCKLGYHLEVPPVPIKSEAEACVSVEVVATPASGSGDSSGDVRAAPPSSAPTAPSAPSALPALHVAATA